MPLGLGKELWRMSLSVTSVSWWHLAVGPRVHRGERWDLRVLLRQVQPGCESPRVVQGVCWRPSQKSVHPEVGQQQNRPIKWTEAPRWPFPCLGREITAFVTGDVYVVCGQSAASKLWERREGAGEGGCCLPFFLWLTANLKGSSRWHPARLSVRLHVVKRSVWAPAGGNESFVSF